MRNIFVLTVFAVFAFASTGITAMMDMGAAPAASEQTECGQESAESDCGMGSGMMGEPGDGAMAPQSMRGYGMGGKYPANEEELRFLTETRELRREIHIKKFDYKEAMRNPESSRKKVGKLAGELWELKQKLYNKRSADQ